jgi:hypothetical protein
MVRINKFWVIIGSLFAVGFIGLVIWRGAWLTYVDNYELAYKFDALTGEIIPLERTGYIIATPLINSVHTIDLRPMQICISANKRTLNCKLVKFNPDGLQLFLAWHGRNDYDSQSEMTGSLRDILMSYAFDGSGRSYPFLTILPSSSDGSGGQNLQPPAVPSVPSRDAYFPTDNSPPEKSPDENVSRQK